MADNKSREEEYLLLPTEREAFDLLKEYGLHDPIAYDCIASRNPTEIKTIVDFLRKYGNFNPKNVGKISVKVDVDVSEALTGLKALQREAREATKALRELETYYESEGKRFYVKWLQGDDDDCTDIREICISDIPTKYLHRELAKREGEVINVIDKDRGLIASIGPKEIIKLTDVIVEINGNEAQSIRGSEPKTASMMSPSELDSVLKNGGDDE